ncbi:MULTISPECIES: Gfo/Idh/MocA family protein [unclassified Pantoea]|uniref:Gfo/Idh/MocA family protein n=1 Tax=unclassified Pantoea TaxID=2630326 RepID=UPI001CD5F278|nr:MULTISPECIES: Gfo/Idh/MocA family oxidoreductase [unclassified Pantoea]MCA1179440.1 Gfo/Idh/MocA family oxidoreductase [Pantoea sp. alder69]MCA1253051.1 Gfo/Idh/MocA family oxidoreductase [Pantoea sp. alder70]MCA1268225.1 Gfo/Idh/MocA family oxidoreductase [Pantoea sp. alder81]
MSKSSLQGRRIRLGMIGGGEGAYIGGIHRFASRLDNEYELVAGAFDVNAERGHAFAAQNHIAADRSYNDYTAMVAAESAREDGVDVVAICTPNFTHFPIARAFLEAGIDVICEKPLTSTLDDAEALAEVVKSTGGFLGVTYTYSGYPLIMEARHRVAEGLIGKVRTVQVEYPLEWMATGVELKNNQQAAWRVDPKKNGRGGSIGDIGTHAYHLAGYVTGLKAESVMADLATFVEGRALDDNAHVMIRYEGGARGLLWSSQVAIGCSNALRLRVFGETGSLMWSQEQPNELIFTALEGYTQIIKRGRDDLSELTKARTRTPPGHPEGYIEAFTNLYSGFASALRARDQQREIHGIGAVVPQIYDGLKGVAFVEAVVDSHEQGTVWKTPKYN